MGVVFYQLEIGDYEFISLNVEIRQLTLSSAQLMKNNFLRRYSEEIFPFSFVSAYNEVLLQDLFMSKKKP